eukprot:sb/3471263/
MCLLMCRLCLDAPPHCRWADPNREPRKPVRTPPPFHNHFSIALIRPSSPHLSMGPVWVEREPGEETPPVVSPTTSEDDEETDRALARWLTRRANARPETPPVRSRTPPPGASPAAGVQRYPSLGMYLRKRPPPPPEYRVEGAAFLYANNCIFIVVHSLYQSVHYFWVLCFRALRARVVRVTASPNGY